MAEQVVYEMSLRDMLTPKVEEANGAVNKLEGSLASVGAAAGIAFGGAAIVGFIKNMITAGTTVENAKTGLTTLLKDANEAQRVIDNTMHDAMVTPFAFEGLLQANKALIAADENADDARKAVLDLANAIAATGGGDDELQRMVVNMQQIKNTGKATAADIKQFAFAGINVYKILANEIYKTNDASTKQIASVKDMDVSYDLLTRSLARAHAAGGAYYNGLENMANNTSVQISNLGDSAFKLAVEMFNNLKPAITLVINALQGFVNIVTDAWHWIVKNKEVIEDFAIGLSIAAAGWGIYTLVVNGATIATNLYATALELVTALMYANPIGLIIVAIAAMITAIIQAYRHWAAFRATLWGVWASIKEFVSLAGEAFTALWHQIHGVFTFNGAEISSGTTKAAELMFTAGQRIAGAFKKGYEGGMADFAADQKAEAKTHENLIPDKKKKSSTAPATPVTPATPKTKAAGSKNVTINVTIKDLIGSYNMNVTNVKEGAAKVKDQIVAALTGAVNDFQITAGE